MRIVEFCGIPGVGKSTICKYYERYLKSHGNKVWNVQILPLCYRGIKRRKFKAKVFFNPKCIKLRLRARKLIPGVGSGEKRKWLDRMMETLYTLELAKKKNIDVALMDEGFLQFVTSIGHGEPINDALLQYTKDIAEAAYGEEDYRVLYLQLDKQEVIKRLKSRNKEGDRFLSEDDAEMENRLNIKEANLLKCLDVLDANRVKTVNLNGENVDQEIIEFLDKQI